MTMRCGQILAALVVLLGSLAPAAPTLAQDVCASCHEDQVKAFEKSGHGRGGGKDAWAGGCVTCHVGAEAHAESGGEKKPQSLREGEKASAACLSCHAGSPKQAHWQGSAHQSAGIACATCHSVHPAKDPAVALPASMPGPTDVTKKCLTCHGGQRASLHQRSSHPLNEGTMSCISCHDAHGTSGEKLIRKASVNDLCSSCHQNMRGPFLWEHSPVREDCLTCHKAHGSNQPQLLQSRVTQLCQSCHQQGRHQTMPGLPSSIFNSGKACLNCHQQIHGSNHPSGPLFQR